MVVIVWAFKGCFEFSGGNIADEDQWGGGGELFHCGAVIEDC